MAEFLVHERTDYYKTEIMYLANRGSMYRLDKCMQTICLMLQASESENFFNENDIDIILGICLRELATPNPSRTRLQILKVLNLILEHTTYLQFYKDKLPGIRTTIEEQILYEDESAQYS